MLLDPLKSVHDFIGILVDVTVLIAAYVAAKEYVNFGHRWTSDLKCSHHDLPDSHVVFTANYTLKNTGRRELEVKKVTIRVTALKEDKQEDTVLLVADETKTYAKPGAPSLRALCAEVGDLSLRGTQCISPDDPINR